MACKASLKHLGTWPPWPIGHTPSTCRCPAHCRGPWALLWGHRHVNLWFEWLGLLTIERSKKSLQRATLQAFLAKPNDEYCKWILQDQGFSPDLSEISAAGDARTTVGEELLSWVSWRNISNVKLPLMNLGPKAAAVFLSGEQWHISHRSSGYLHQASWFARRRSRLWKTMYVDLCPWADLFWSRSHHWSHLFFSISSVDLCVLLIFVGEVLKA